MNFILKESWKEMYHSFHKNNKQHNCQSISWAANQHIRINSEGSCDTEDWRNDAENSGSAITEINYVLKYASKWKQLF